MYVKIKKLCNSIAKEKVNIKTAISLDKRYGGYFLNLTSV